MGKTETVFGEINTNYIIETTNGTDEIFYTFPITPNTAVTGSEVYNLVVKTDDTETETAKVLIYEPATEWILNGNNDYLTFSGTIKSYSLDGNIESAVAYVNGDCKPEPCPDCPTNPQGPGGGNPGGGGGGTGGGGGGNPGGGGDGPTGTGGPVSYPGTGGSTTGGGTSGGGTSGGGTSGGGGGGEQCEVCDDYDDEGHCMFSHWEACTSNFTANRAPANTCDTNESGGGGVVITTQDDLCTKTKSQLGTASVKEVMQNLKTHITSGAGGEKGYGIKKNGTASPTTENSDHSVNFGDPSLLNAGYHNHTGTKVDIFSSTDIATLIEIARYNGSSNPTNAFMGLIAPNGIHYIIRFNGLQKDLPAFGSFSETQIEIWKIDQITFMSKLIKDNEFTQTINGKKILNSKGLEQILFNTLEKMGLKDKVVVQKIDDNNNVSIVIQNPDKTTTLLPCP